MYVLRMYPYGEPLQPLCSWSGYGAGYRPPNLLQFVVYSRPFCKIPLPPLTLGNLCESNSSSFASVLVLPHFYARVHTQTHTHTHKHTHGTCSARVNRVQQLFVQKPFAVPLWHKRMQLAFTRRSLDVHRSVSSCRVTDWQFMIFTRVK